MLDDNRLPYPKTDETIVMPDKMIRADPNGWLQVISAARHIGVKLGTIPEALFVEALGEDATPSIRQMVKQPLRVRGFR